MEQQRRFRDSEISLIKTTFKDNLDLLKTVRKFMLQMELTEKEEMAIRTQIKGDTFRVVKKCFLPEIECDAPIMQTVDLWLTLNFAEKDPDLALLHIKARGMLISYIGDRLKEILGVRVVSSLQFNDMIKMNSDAENAFVNLLARNTIAMHIEQQLNQLNILANEVSETPEKLGEKKKKNSTK